MKALLYCFWTRFYVVLVEAEVYNLKRRLLEKTSLLVDLVCIPRKIVLHEFFISLERA